MEIARTNATFIIWIDIEISNNDGIPCAQFTFKFNYIVNNLLDVNFTFFIIVGINLTI